MFSLYLTTVLSLSHDWVHVLSLSPDFDHRNPPHPGGVSLLSGSLIKSRVGRAASRGALAPEPPRATRSQPESIWIRAKTLFFRAHFRLSP